MTRMSVIVIGLLIATNIVIALQVLGYSPESIPVEIVVFPESGEEAIPDNIFIESMTGDYKKQFRLFNGESLEGEAETGSVLGATNGLVEKIIDTLTDDGENIDSDSIPENMEEVDIFTGEVLIVNEQGIPIPEIVVTLQFVIGNIAVDIDQFTTNEDGIAEYSFDLDYVVPLWTEVIDVFGENVNYSSYLNEASRVVASPS